MKKLFVILFLLNQLSGYTQTTKTKLGIIKGKVIDAKTKVAIPYVNIVCRNTHKQIITGSITNNKGLFTVKNLPLKTIFVEVHFIGYKSIYKTIELSKNLQKHNIETLLLIEDSTNLDEVTLETNTSTIVQKIDRKVILIGKDLEVTGANSLEMLESVPSVNVDYLSGSISLRGNENVRVLIDGKPSNLKASQALKQIPSSLVKKIELITNPSAKYNPEGMSGIINIVLKKNTSIGFNGSISVGAKHSKNTRPTNSINMNYKIGKVNFYGNYGLDWGDYETGSKLERTDKDALQNFDFLDRSLAHYLKVGADLFLSKSNTLSFYTSQNFIKTDFSTETKIFENQNLIFHSPNLAIFDISEKTYNIDFKKDLKKKGSSIEIEFNYISTKNPDEDTFKELQNPSSKEYNYNNSIVNDDSTWLVNIDYVNSLSNNGKLELGVEARINNTLNKITTNQEISSIPVGNTDFKYDRHTYSGYVNYSQNFNKISLQTGVRLEQFRVNGVYTNTQLTNPKTYSDNIFSVYPSAYITYSYSDKNQFQLGYSRRVDRPSIIQVSPIIEWASPLTLSVGNKNLKPQFTNSYELNYTASFSKGYITFGTFYRSISDKIGRVIFADASNPDKQIISYTNYKTANNYGIELSGSVKATKWWSIRPGFDLYEQNSEGVVNNQFNTVKNTRFKARVSNSFKLSKKIRFQLSGSYSGENKNVQFIVAPYFMINAAASLSILDGRGALTLRGTDIFNTVNFRYTSTNPFPQKGAYNLELNSVYIGFNYSFGSGKNKALRRKYREKNETSGSSTVF